MSTNTAAILHRHFQGSTAKPTRGIWGCWQWARAYRGGPIIHLDPPIIQPTPQKLCWQISHIALNTWQTVRAYSFCQCAIHFTTLPLYDTFLSIITDTVQTLVFINNNGNTFRRVFPTFLLIWVTYDHVEFWGKKWRFVCYFPLLGNSDERLCKLWLCPVKCLFTV